MIRICKNADKPQTLDKSYNTDEVCKQLLMDQNDKCYLCERRLTTDYQVEHFKSQANNGDLKQTWENLFVACGYCNNKKSNKYDDILDPTQYDIETIIEHSNDFVNQKRLQEMRLLCRNYIRVMSRLGFSQEDILLFVQEYRRSEI